MKVLFVTRGFPSDKNPMDGNYEAVQAKAIAKKGHEVAVVSIRFRSLLHIFEHGKVVHRFEDNVDVYICTCFILFIPFIFNVSIPIVNRRLSLWAYKHVVKRYISEKGMPDIVHAHSMFCAGPVAFLKDDYHLPFVITEHWSEMYKDIISEWQKRNASIYYKADRIICVSQVLADSVKRKFQIDSIVINNMVSDLFFKTKKVIRSDGNFKFIACGAFRKNKIKGFDLLVDAFALAHFPDNVHLSIVGDGEDRPFIEHKIAEYNLSNQIHLLGLKTPEDVSDLLRQSDCFVLSSRLETFSIVVIEAMAKGLPVVATKCGGPETFLLPEHGILVEKENIKELANAMQCMIEHHTDYNSDNIRKYCYDHFSQDVIADQIIGVYNKVLNHY